VQPVHQDVQQRQADYKKSIAALHRPEADSGAGCVSLGRELQLSNPTNGDSPTVFQLRISAVAFLSNENFMKTYTAADAQDQKRNQVALLQLSVICCMVAGISSKPMSPISEPSRPPNPFC
jgi:hypothetical protein